MKTIQIPLELAEEILQQMRDITPKYQRGNQDVLQDLPDSYHQLKKFVDDKHTFDQWQEADRMIEKMELNVPKLSKEEILIMYEQAIKESIKDVVKDLKEKGEAYKKSL